MLTGDLPMVDLPDYMNRSIWFDTSSRNIRYYFDLEASDDPNTEITSAVLRLHLKRRDGMLFNTNYCIKPTLPVRYKHVLTGENRALTGENVY